MACEKLIFTPNDVIDKILINDRTVDVIGYVDVIERPKIVGKLKKYKLIKFAVNNGGGKRIQCIAWKAQVDYTVPAVKLNKVIYLDGVHAKKIENLSSKMGTEPFELIINSNTTINDLGLYNGMDNAEILTVALTAVGGTTRKISQVAAKKSMISAGQEERKIAEESGNIIKGMALTSVTADGSWLKQSYRTSGEYSSMSGAGAIVGFNTRKIHWWP